jgi:dTDP-4-amino-4,6-dideoxygalactose transaminase
MVVTSDAQVAENRKCCATTAPGKYYHLCLFNSRLTPAGSHTARKLKYLDGWIKLRREKAALYAGYLGKIAGVEVPRESEGCYHCFNYYRSG